MKKSFYFAAAAIALASCTSEDFLGEGPANVGGESNAAISFGSKTVALTRGDHTGSDAATLLGENFVVEGIKGDGTVQKEVFDHYNVNYTASTANTTESNTNDWEYVDETAHTLSKLTTLSQKQTIKFWDYSAKQYDYIAFSYGTSNSSDLALTKMTYANLGKATSTGTPVYTVSGSAEDLSKAYIADLVTLYNHDGVSEYGTTVVTPKFRSLGTKVRLAFYETVPGYAVSNVKFYSEAWDGNKTTGDGEDDPTIFAASAIFPSATTTGTMSVYYPTVGWAKSGNNGSDPKDADYNQAHITFAAGTGTGALVTTKTFDALNYTATAQGNETCTDILGRTSATATYAGDVTATNHAYEIVLPLGTKDNIQLRIEYDLYPLDGSQDVIHVRDARAVVPAAYCEWKPNYAYTYIFKISDNTNGWTGVDGSGNVVEGLTPITFDAVVVDTEDGIQETITTVATPSITTYQEGEVVTAGSEYQAGDIYVSVMNGTTPVTLTDSPANYAVYLVTAGEDKVNEAIAQDMLNGVKSNTGITWTPAIYEAVSEVPSADGNTLTVSAAKFAAASGKTYVFDVVIGGKNYVKVIRVQ